MELSILINKFNIKGRLVSLQPFGNGNINDTFLAIYRNTFTESQVILQRVNSKVFVRPEVIMRNMHAVCKHCHEKLDADARAGLDDRVWQMPRIIKAKDSGDYVVDENGIDYKTLQIIKEQKRDRISTYLNYVPTAKYFEDKDGSKGIWTVPCDIALPCATQNELDLEGAKALVANGCMAVVEGANMPTTLDATKYLQENGVYFVPGKASNAGGVATSGLEMTQNSERLSWSFEEVDAKLQTIMVNIFHNLDDAAKKYGMPGNYVAGANIAGFLKVAEAMKAQGCV